MEQARWTSDGWIIKPIDRRIRVTTKKGHVFEGWPWPDDINLVGTPDDEKALSMDIPVDDDDRTGYLGVDPSVGQIHLRFRWVERIDILD